MLGGHARGGQDGHQFGHAQVRPDSARLLGAGEQRPVGTELADGSVTDPAASRTAFEDVERLFLAGLVVMVPGQLRDIANLALAGGLRRAVVLASHGSDFEDETSPETWQWLAFEQALRKHGAEWTRLRPAGLFAGLLVGGTRSPAPAGPAGSGAGRCCGSSCRRWPSR